MRESNFSNPAQNKACVCISAAVYDRRAIDCTATLPLINSLNHLAYLTSTSPRIREMVTLDGGLERLIRILRTIPKTPSPNARAISIKEMQAIWKWSLAFQCVVNIGVRGSENVRTRVVEAGMVPVTIRVLESYLRGVEQAKEERRREAAESNRREERSHRSGQDADARTSGSAQPAASRLATAAVTSRQRASSSSTTHQPAALPSSEGLDVDVEISEAATAAEPTATEALQLAAHRSSRTGSNGRLRHLVSETRPTTPLEGSTASTVLAGMESRSSSDGFLEARTSNLPGGNDDRSPLPIIDALDSMPLAPAQVDLDGGRLHPPVSPSASSSSELPSAGVPESNGADFGSRAPSNSGVLTNVSSTEDLRGHGGEASGSGSEGVEDADMFADEADDSELDAAAASHRRSTEDIVEDAEDRRTPRPTRRALAPLADQEAPAVFSSAFNTPAQSTAAMVSEPTVRQDAAAASARTQTLNQSEFQQQLAERMGQGSRSRNREAAPAIEGSAQSGRERERERERDRSRRAPSASAGANGSAARVAQPAHHTVAAAASTTVDMIYREEEVLLSLQLLAYLSKYAHVRTLFHSSDLANTKFVGPLDVLNENLNISTDTSRSWDPSETPKRNVFSVAEKFTLRSSRSSSSHPAPRLAMEIQYWAGVIMRNACRKDESRGGIRQCANMLCGKWEAFPREFAKCRRCRKAKYCSKQCQSKGWQMGHRFWCSSRSDDGDARERERDRGTHAHGADGRAHPTVVAVGAVGTRPGEIGFAAGQTMDEDLAGAAQRFEPPAAGNDQQEPAQAAARSPERSQVPSHLPGQQRAQALGHSHNHGHVQHLAYSQLARGRDETDVAPSSQLHSTAGSQLDSASLEALNRQDLDQMTPRQDDPPQASGSQPGFADNQPRARRLHEIVGARGLPSTLAGGHLQDRRVSSLASVDTIDGSDFSDDELDRRMVETEGMHPAVAAAAAAAAVAAGGRNRGAHEVPIVAPQRTDLAGRPLPPPVIASQNADEDELALGGRATPGAAGDQDFGDGAFDQMLGHWDPSRTVGGMGLQHRLTEVRAEIPSPDRSSSPDVGASQDEGARSEGRSDDELHAPRARYHALYGHQQPHYSTASRAHQPFSHRLQQQRSISGFATPVGSAPHSFGSSSVGPSALHPTRAIMTPSPLSANPVRSFRDVDRAQMRSHASEDDVEMADRVESGHARTVSHTPTTAGLDRRQRSASTDRMSSSLSAADGDVAMDY
ncbi:uncharacterized protein PFL1_01996 [Pseudozyma flocculosa PF-1]|uniref:uncharacterized protein n=1 Tax=Pseudozyma flocculosa PF-1 TaxID=1277687 RepID=UPI000456125B|nr:uncharacterized protein PFL1_01996 [Pseudozyma flocculosa PF-1]EPQ30470.1 hypothetical protein PFL1_01996 [Pseudozyma flocculosa PF-1]